MLLMKYLAGENVVNLVSYLKGMLLLLKNYTDLLVDTLGLLNDIMTLAINVELCDYMKSIYYEWQKESSNPSHTWRRRRWIIGYYTM